MSNILKKFELTRPGFFPRLQGQKAVLTCGTIFDLRLEFKQHFFTFFLMNKHKAQY